MCTIGGTMNTFKLKMIALAAMVIDHIGYYFEDMPLLLRAVGRISFPLFLFCMIWGYHYTSDRKKFLLRLYRMSVFMGIFMYGIEKYFPTDGFGYGYHNIFATMLWVGIFISTIETYIEDRRKGLLCVVGVMALVLIHYAAPVYIPFLRGISGDYTASVFPNFLHVEYGFAYIVLGVLMYFSKERTELLGILYILFCVYQLAEELSMPEYGFPLQWLMIFALPMMIRYNNEKGYDLKYFFYAFYPAHTFLLFYLANFVVAA